MQQPQSIANEWKALADAVGTNTVSDDMRRLAGGVLENAGLSVHFAGDMLYAEESDVDPDTGVAGGIRFEIVQVA